MCSGEHVLHYFISSLKKIKKSMTSNFIDYFPLACASLSVGHCWGSFLFCSHLNFFNLIFQNFIFGVFIVNIDICFYLFYWPTLWNTDEITVVFSHFGCSNLYYIGYLHMYPVWSRKVQSIDCLLMVLSSKISNIVTLWSYR